MCASLLLVDGNALMYRAYHAFPKEFTTPDGVPSGAAFGFTRMLMAAVRNLKPTHLAVCFDTKGATFRDELLEQYKAQRAPMPDDLVKQVPMIWELVDRLEAPRYCLTGFEADDLIGTLVKQVEQQHPDFEIIIMTGDQDLIQLVSQQTSVFMPAAGFAKAVMYTPAKVQEKYGFAPLQMIDYKALRGDSSDNIPGIPGIGEVTGKALISQFQTLDQLYQAVHSGQTDGIKPGILQKLQTHEELARLSYKVATIKTDIDISFKEADCRLKIDHPDKLIELFQKYGFRSLINELPHSHRLVTEAADIFSAPSVQQAPDQSSDLDQKLEPVLRQMEKHGVIVNKTYFAKLELEFQTEINQLTKTIFDLAGQPFNLDSPSQMANILYTHLQIPTDFIRKGKQGFTTDADALTKLAPTYPICAHILKYRELSKLISTYIKPLQELADPEGRIHTSYAPDTATGRISSRNPNLQNIPIKTENGRQIRKGFIAPAKCVLMAADYSQIELRVAAHLSQDPVMVNAFLADQDFHAETAARMKVDRRVAKIINFSILYGKGAYGFSQDLGISMAAAKEYIDQYFQTFAKLKQYTEAVLEQARHDGYATTLLGHRRSLPDLKSPNYQKRSAAERETINLPIQGTAAEILKLAMLELNQKLKHNQDAKMILTVHDELVLEVQQDAIAKTAQLVRQTMENAYKLIVPLKVEVKVGQNWAELEPVS